VKVKDICKQYGLEANSFQTWLGSSGYQYKTGAMGGVDVTDGQDIAAMVEHFRREQAEQQEQASQNAAAQKEALHIKQQTMANMIITPGYNFDGYTITKYSGYISGDHAVQIQRGTNFFGTGITNVGGALTDALVEIRRQALLELKEAAYSLGCNAIIGIDFDYLTLQPEVANTKGEIKLLPYVFCVTANGNAVVIEKNRSTAFA